MLLSRRLRIALRIATAAILVFIYVPIGLIVLYSFNSAKVASWPIQGLTLQWYQNALTNPGIRSALLTSFQAAIGATIAALLLGSLVAFAIQRYSFFGRQSLSFLVVLPLALPGIVTGIALNTSLRAIGSTATKLTVLCPKNRYRVSANEASVPSTSATSDASNAVSSERNSASRGPDACDAARHQSSVKPCGGHTNERALLMESRAM